MSCHPYWWFLTLADVWGHSYLSYLHLFPIPSNIIIPMVFMVFMMETLGQFTFFNLILFSLKQSTNSIYLSPCSLRLRMDAIFFYRRYFTAILELIRANYTQFMFYFIHNYCALSTGFKGLTFSSITTGIFKEKKRQNCQWGIIQSTGK